MMAGNPNWWSVDTSVHNPQPQYVFGSSSMSNPSPATDHRYLHLNGHEFPARSWSQLLMSGSVHSNEEAENWEDQLSSSLKQEENCQLIYGQYSLDVDDDNEFVRPNILVPDSPWHHHHHNRPVSSPTSCITTLNNNNNILSFSNHNRDHSSECNSTGTGGASKKARVSQCSPQPAALKVRKEKLGDRITTLHNLVSPFGKTDTASVLSEAIGYIRFLQAQIEALSSPYMRNASAAANKIPHQHSVQESNCLFPDETDQNQSGAKDLRRMGLCLVPTSCTQSIENESEADYWAPAAFNFSWRQG